MLRSSAYPTLDHPENTKPLRAILGPVLVNTGRGLFMAKTKEPLADFRNFLFMVWKHLGLPEPTPRQYEIAERLQHGERRMNIQAFRGIGKSWVTSAFVCWTLYRDPQKKILVVSASKARADDFTTFTLRLIQDIPCLRHLTPKPTQRCSKLSFDVGPARPDHAPSVKSMGITSAIAGSRADLIIPDDIEVLNNSLTQSMRDKLSEAVKEFDAVLKPEGSIVYLGTPQTQQSIYNALVARGYTTYIWPARYPDSEARESYGSRLVQSIASELEANPELAGKPTDPSRFDDMDLIEREASYGRAGFALQFMLLTRLSDMDRYPLKLSDLMVTDLDPDNAPQKLVWASGPAQSDEPLNAKFNVGFDGDRYYRPMETIGPCTSYTGSVMFIDPSGRGRDETAYAVVKMLNGYLFLVAVGGVQGYGEGAMTDLAKIAKTHKTNAIRIESNFGDGMFTQMLKPILNQYHPCDVEEVRHSTQKERRIIDTLEPVMSQHKLVVDRKVVEYDMTSTDHYSHDRAPLYQLFYQLTRVTYERGALVQDDRLDALAGAVGYWVEKMGQNVDHQIERAKEKRRKDALRAFLRKNGVKPVNHLSPRT